MKHNKPAITIQDVLRVDRFNRLLKVRSKIMQSIKKLDTAEQYVFIDKAYHFEHQLNITKCRRKLLMLWQETNNTIEML